MLRTKCITVWIGLFAWVVSCAGGVDQPRSTAGSELKHEYQYVSRKVQAISTNINRYIDILVMVIREGLNNIDPYPLPDVVEQFEEKVWIVPLSGQFLMKNGIIHNLNTISRRGNASLNYDNQKLYIDAEFIFDLILFDYSFLSEIASMGPRGYLTGYAKDLVFQSVFVYDIDLEKISLHSLKLIEKGEVKVTVTVSKMIDWLANPIINWLSKLYEEKLLILLRNVLQKIVGEHLPPKEILFLTKL